MVKVARLFHSCYHICDKGNCSGPPDYVCNCSLGWTGDSCNISCGCNNHSTCKKNGVGTCDACQQNTAGEHCEICQPGSYGDPQLPAGRRVDFTRSYYIHDWLAVCTLLASCVNASSQAVEKSYTSLWMVAGFLFAVAVFVPPNCCCFSEIFLHSP